jgi:raffinose/stachyose/melibiose transport system substrate-binding protein
MMRITRAVAALVAAGLAVGGLAACSGSGGGDTNKVTLTYWKLTDTNPGTKKAWAETMAGFEKKYPNIELKVRDYSTDQLKQSLRTSLGSSAAPDVYWSWGGLGIGGEYVKAGGSLDLTKYYKKYGWEKEIPASSMSTVKQYGGYNGVPSGYSGAGVYYRKDLFAKAGITTEPKTYDELVADAQKLSDSGTTPITFGGTVNWHLMRWLDNILMTECGSKTYNALIGLKADWGTTPCVTKAYDQFAMWSQKYLVKGWASLSDSEADNLFETGKAAMVIEGTWYPTVLQGDKVDLSNIGVFLFPTGTGELYGDTSNNYITPTSKHPDQAAQFLDYLMSPEAQKINLDAAGTRPVNTNVKIDPAKQDPLNRTWNGLIANAKGLYEFNDQALSLTNVTEYWRIQNAVASGDIKPADAGAQFQKFLKNNK